MWVRVCGLTFLVRARGRSTYLRTSERGGDVVWGKIAGETGEKDGVKYLWADAGQGRNLKGNGGEGEGHTLKRWKKQRGKEGGAC